MMQSPDDFPFDYRHSMHPPGCARAFWIGICAIIAVGALMCWMVGARAHEATPTAAQPLGWAYPWACCSGLDCRTVGDSLSGAPVKVYETAEGYRFNTSTEVIPYGDKRLRDSPDGEFHWCTTQGKDDAPTICLFVPPRGF